MSLYPSVAVFIDNFQVYTEYPSPVTRTDVFTMGRNVSYLLRGRAAELGFDKGCVEVIALEAFVKAMTSYAEDGMVPSYTRDFLQTARRKLTDAEPYLD